MLVEGAVANEDHLETIQKVRERSQILVSFGDCAVTGNVTALRNPLDIGVLEWKQYTLTSLQSFSPKRREALKFTPQR